MADTFDSLASDLRVALADAGPGQQFWLGIVGAPGAGKSTLSRELAQRIGDSAVVIAMDGYHFYRTELDAMADLQKLTGAAVLHSRSMHRNLFFC